MKELDPTKPVQLRDGRQVRNVCWDYLLSNGMIGISAIVRTNDNEHDFYQLWYSNGIAYQGKSDNSNDLINVPERIEGWVNIYNEGDIMQLCRTKEMADKYASKQGRIACIKISFTVGEGLE